MSLDESTQDHAEPPTPGHGDPRSATGPAAHGATLGGQPLDALIRRVRRTADMSQRELARAAEVSPATVGRIEAATMTPSLPLLERLLVAAAGHRLVIVDSEGRLTVPLQIWDDITDLQGRRFPAHLDTILDPEYGQWWADVYGLSSPPETFRRDRERRDYERRRSQWQVRVKQLRFAPEPVPPGGWTRRTG